MSERSYPLWPLPALAGMLPFVGVVFAWWVSVAQGHVADCNPFIEGCTSVSRTGRHGTGFLIFKAAVLPAAPLMFAFWWLAADWAGRAGAGPGWCRAVRLIGCVAALAMVVYTATLGSNDAAHATLRRAGATLFLAGTFFAEMLLTLALREWARAHAGRLWTGLLALVTGQFLLGLVSLPLTAYSGHKAYWESVIEWNFGLLMLLWFPLLARVWHRLELRLNWG